MYTGNQSGNTISLYMSAANNTGNWSGSIGVVVADAACGGNSSATLSVTSGNCINSNFRMEGFEEDINVESSVSPNPATNVLNVHLNKEQFKDEPVSVQIINLNGQMLQEIQSKSLDLTINTSNYDKGLYIVRASNQNSTYSSKFSIAK
jgi:hypothetical protein